MTQTPAPTLCNSPVAFVSFNSLTSTTNSTSFTYTFATNSAPSSIVIVEARRTNSSGSDLMTGASWDFSFPMTLITSMTSGTTHAYAAWAITNPAASTSGSVIVNAAASGSGSTMDTFAAQYSNVDTFTPLGAFNSSSGTANPISTSITTQAPQSVIVGFYSNVGGIAGHTFDSGQTSRWSSASASGGSGLQFFDVPAAVAAPYTLSATATSNSEWGQILIELENLSCITPTPSKTATASPTITLTITPTFSITPTITITSTIADPHVHTFSISVDHRHAHPYLRPGRRWRLFLECIPHRQPGSDEADLGAGYHEPAYHQRLFPASSPWRGQRSPLYWRDFSSADQGQRVAGDHAQHVELVRCLRFKFGGWQLHDGHLRRRADAPLCPGDRR